MILDRQRGPSRGVSRLNIAVEIVINYAIFSIPTPFGTYRLSWARFLTATRTGTLRPRGALAPLSKPTLSTQMYNGA